MRLVRLVPALLALAPLAAPKLPVDVAVLARSDGTGNELWSEAHVRAVLERAGQLAHGEVDFVLASYRRFSDDGLWTGASQARVLGGYARGHARPGRLMAVVSSPDTTDSAGKSSEWSALKRFTPAIVIRSRRNDGSQKDLDESARIFLHELGHTVGFAHDGTAVGHPYPTDGWWDLPPARAVVVTLGRWMELHARGAPPGLARTRFACTLGGKVPGTNQLFDPPTDAPTEDECAARCLALDACVAFARPTWENARCFLFGRGARVTTDPGWRNVDTCWRR